MGLDNGRGLRQYRCHMATVTIEANKCGRCSYIWVAKARDGEVKVPSRCPNCWSRRWREAPKAERPA